MPVFFIKQKTRQLDRFRITEDLYNKKLKEYKERQSEIMTELRIHEVADESYYLTVNKVFSLAQRAYKIFESSEILERRQLLNFLLQNIELKGKKLLYKLKTPWDTVLLANHQPAMLRGWFYTLGQSPTVPSRYTRPRLYPGLR